ncbi:hypothetical protein QJQ45_001274 [Haematococcus lacustris]|nr:hypothetical protein QJQ45_001274 [Haematococcus lacustris]
MRTLHLNQPRFVAELVTSHGMADAHPKTLPMSTSTKLSREGTALITRQHNFSGLVGSLMYLACCTRPDIASAVGALARHMATPTEQHWQATRAVLSFVKGTTGHGLMLGGSTALQEAEYMAATTTVKEALWLSKLLRDLQLPEGSVNSIASNRSKHIDVHHHFARERAAQGEVQFEYCCTDSMVADIMTKA